MNLKVDLPVAQAAPARPGTAPHQAPLMLHGGAPLMGVGGPAIRMGGLGAGAGLDMGAGAGAGAGMGMGAPMGMRVGVGDPFVFGAGQAHRFAPPAFGVPQPPAFHPLPRLREAAIPEPAIPLALARGRRAPPARPPAQAVAAAGGGLGGRRRKGR